tara:strand:- start:4910 stop:6019 length:1110 start_codon:yes stop_codon:yes gene_type:complete
MDKEQLVATLRLQCIPNVGDVTAKKLIAHCGNAQEVFSNKKTTLLKIEGVGSYALANLFDGKYLEAAIAEYEYILSDKVEYSYFMDKEYPLYLKHCLDAPILLFKRGHMDWGAQKCISIVGTRNMTTYGSAFCERLIADLAPLDPIIVSGFAYGVDICIHRAAVKNGLQTIGCLAHGLNQIYPKVHSRYMADVERNGGFMTEFWSSSEPERENFLKRNRIIAGMGEATIVIESAEKGGSLVTADIANGYNRDVFAVPGRTDDPYSKGCNDLIKQHKAHMITSAADLIYIMGWELDSGEGSAPLVQKKLFVELDPHEQIIHSYLQREGKQLLDTIALKCQMPVFKVSSLLINMEMKGVIRPLPGKLFEAI